MAESPKTIVLIPAYNPGSSLPDVVRGLLEKGVGLVVVVNDGSLPESDYYFEAIRALPGVHLLRHAVNLGKGAALKTALNYAYCEFPQSAGFVTADADGQHAVEDILAVARKQFESPESLVMGIRLFTGDVPLRSRIGNNLTRTLARWLLGQKLSDTQTGLRGIPRTMVPTLIKLPTNGYEFELDMLIAAKQEGRRVVEVPIRTIYLDGNKSSQFNPILDSMKIYIVLLRFSAVALLSAFLDNALFILTYNRSQNILGSQVFARVIAICFNYWAARKTVFLSKEKTSKTFTKYIVLAIANVSISYILIRLISSETEIPVPWIKICVETFLFIVNFLLQRDFVFAKQGSDRQAGSSIRRANAAIAGTFKRFRGDKADSVAQSSSGRLVNDPDLKRRAEY